VEPSREKRRARRVRVESPARVKLAEAAGQVTELEARTRDISRNGVFLYIDRNLTAGAHLELIVMLPEEISEDGRRSWVCCQGTVVRVEGGEVRSAADEQHHSCGIAARFDKLSVLPEL
jgi:c-di-GMP-binding flagellar brake protein YcgR